MLSHVDLAWEGTGHAPLYGTFEIPDLSHRALAWPKPGLLPWDSINVEEWQHSNQEKPALPLPTDLTSAYQHFGNAFEESITPHLDDSLSSLPNSCRGRGARLDPEDRAVSAPLPRPGRPGDPQLVSDFVGRAIIHWYQQMKRLQHLCHATKGNKSHPEAVQHRSDTWRAVLRARGFQDGFPTWWSSRSVKLQGSPLHLPVQPPAFDVLLLVKDDFEANFRQFESWNIRQRSQALQLLLQQHRRRLFQSVKAPSPGAPQSLQKTVSTTILAVNDDGTEIHTEHDLTAYDHVQWTIADSPAEITLLAPNHLKVESDCLLFPGQEVQASIELVTPKDVFAELNNFWSKRWAKITCIPDSTWRRITAFSRAFLPSKPLQLEDLTAADWSLGLKRFHDRSARGPDGYDRLDLQRMPSGFQAALLDLVNQIERTHSWPRQLTEGHAIGIPKVEDARTADALRPIVVTSVVHRCWSSIRARQVLRHLEHMATFFAIGFLPDREAGELWMMTQALIEISLITDADLIGHNTDISKAFDCLPRPLTTSLLRHFGLPDRLVSTWHNWLRDLRRRWTWFSHIGMGITSTTGYPQGCALSCTGMLAIDLAYHFYMIHYAPRTIATSFVDNYSLLANSVGDLVHGLVVQSCFFELWQLDQDLDKTYCWALASTSRQRLVKFGQAIRTHARDLGGNMTYQRKRLTSLLLDTIRSLEPHWQRLRRLQAAEPLKSQVIVQALWPKIFHAPGINSCPGTVIQKLRTTAARALGHGKAGAQPLIRLSLLGSTPMCDPGLFRLWAIFRDFRRLSFKQPLLLELWQQFMQQFTGVFHPGPFSALLEQFELLSWRILEPPYIEDHDTLIHDFLELDEATLWQRTQDAWHQHIARSVAHRKDFEGLHGLDWACNKAVLRSRSPLDRARLNSLIEGAFITGQIQAKFDTSQTGLCACCQLPDTVEHRCTTCPGLHHVHVLHEYAVRQWPRLPRCLTHHLCLPRNPHHGALLHAHADPHPRYHLVEPGEVPDSIDVFTDGSCFRPEHPLLALAGWAAIATHDGSPISHGPLAGHHQSISRAEITAIVATLHWVVEFANSSNLTIWSDSAFAATQFQELLHQQELRPEHRDLWQDVLPLLRLRIGSTGIQHISAHGDLRNSTGPLQDWTIQWNARADHFAKQAAWTRSWSFLQVYDRYLQHEAQALIDLNAVALLHLSIAEAGACVPFRPRRTRSPLMASLLCLRPFGKQVSIGWIRFL